LENFKRRNHLGNLGTDGRILKYTLQKQGEDVDWIQVAQKRIKLLAFVNTVTKLKVPYKQGIS
jgi:hypothetical protein